jgi:hypothetical protein
MSYGNSTMILITHVVAEEDRLQGRPDVTGGDGRG